MSWKCEDAAGVARPELESSLTRWKDRVEIVRTSTVTVERLLAPDGAACVLKRYRFPILARRLEAAFRHTWLAQPKARREMRALASMQALGVPVVSPIGCGWRRDALGFVVDSFLLTQWWPHADLARRIAAKEHLPPAAWQALGAAVGLLHTCGVRHGGLAARNLLVGEESPSGWQARLLDPARARFRGRPLTRAEADRDLVPLEPALALADPGRREAFNAGYCNPSLPSSAARTGSTSRASPTMP